MVLTAPEATRAQHPLQPPRRRSPLQAEESSAPWCPPDRWSFVLPDTTQGRWIRTRVESKSVAFRFVVCDVFTDVPLQGNQVAVFTDAREIPEEHLQRLARET